MIYKKLYSLKTPHMTSQALSLLPSCRLQTPENVKIARTEAQIYQLRDDQTSYQHTVNIYANQSDDITLEDEKLINIIESYDKRIGRLRLLWPQTQCPQKAHLTNILHQRRK